MKQNDLFTPVPASRLALQSKEDLILYIELQQKVNLAIIKDNERLRSLHDELKQKSLFVEDQLIILNNKFYGKSSEKSPKQKDESSEGKDKKPPRTRVLLPSQRYPDAPLIEREVTFEKLPFCSCCNAEMVDTGMTEDSEFLTVVPAQFIVVLQKRHKYGCNDCHGDLKTAPPPPRIKPGSAYSDEMMVDVSLTKYCDLIPVERYASIAGRAGLEDLPPQSLIESTHYVAEYVKHAYDKLKEELLAELFLHADETPHRMLEGSSKKSWYVWGFSSANTSYFEYHDTRSGDVASDLLKKSKCEFLMSDVYSGYSKAVRETNIYRDENNLKRIISLFCNAHARRKFKDSFESFPEESQFYIDKYKLIYKLEDLTDGKPPDEILELRSQMIVHFEEMKLKAMSDLIGCSSKSSLYKALNYFLGNYAGFTLFIKHYQLPIDNNPQERLMRNPVIGRKTWYGTHSKLGAKTAAILFSLVESCKLNKINPREYFKNLIQDLHQGKAAYTPKKYAEILAATSV
jgi:transposase